MSFLYFCINLALASFVFAHGFIKEITAEGRTYSGFDPNLKEKFDIGEKLSPAWTTSAVDQGYINVLDSPDIICHKSATPGAEYVTAVSGHTLQMQWTNWPGGHHGPILVYLADCNGDCQQISKETLRFTKIFERGVVDSSTPPGHWATDEFMGHGQVWHISIPHLLAPGRYVLRYEMIALHSAHANNTQHYPQCVNLEIDSTGDIDLPNGTLGTQLYDTTSSINIWQPFAQYNIPGPPLWQI